MGNKMSHKGKQFLLYRYNSYKLSTLGLDDNINMLDRLIRGGPEHVTVSSTSRN